MGSHRRVLKQAGGVGRSVFCKDGCGSSVENGLKVGNQKTSKGTVAIGRVRADGGYNSDDGSRDGEKVSSLEKYLGGKKDRIWKWIG